MPPMQRRAALAIGLTMALAGPAHAQVADDAAADGLLDASADRVTLRPLALPDRMLEVQANLIWTTSPRFEGPGLTTPLDTELGVRMSVGRTELHVGLILHARYPSEDNRPSRAQWTIVGADYQISQLFVAGLELRNRHLFGGPLEQGFDIRADIGTKWIAAPWLALVGYSGAALQQRSTTGQVGNPRAFQIVADGAVQVAPIERVTLEALTAIRFNITGDLYGDNTFLVDIGAAVTGNIVRQLDAYASAVLVLVPRDREDRIFTFGVKYRHP
jgi:hypothetical protein